MADVQKLIDATQGLQESVNDLAQQVGVNQALRPAVLQ